MHGMHKPVSWFYKASFLCHFSYLKSFSTIQITLLLTRTLYQQALCRKGDWALGASSILSLLANRHVDHSANRPALLQEIGQSSQ